MSFLGLVGAPLTPLTYAEYQALKSGGTALAGALAGAEAAAVASIALQGAAVLGAGALGWMIGTQIRKNLGLDDEDFETSTWVTGGAAGQQVRVFFTIYNTTPTPISTAVVVTAPFAGVLRRQASADFDEFYMLSTTTGTIVPMASFSREGFPNAYIKITSFETLAGEPITSFRPVPVYPQKKPYVPVVVPTTIPATPSTPEFPITPQVVPTPGNDPDEDNKLVGPGLTVKIPELGLQVQYTPTGVGIGRYTDPGTKPYEPPKAALPPGQIPPASEPCPCDDGENKDDEIICRIKTLQDEILDDGYTFTTTIIPSGTGGSTTSIEDELISANVFVDAYPSNVRVQPYPAINSDVYWVGWFSWTHEGRAGERIPLQFLNNSFYPPPECDGFQYAFNYGVTGSASFVTRRKKPYVDNC